MNLSSSSSSPSASAPERVLVMGAGAVGCWLGGALQAAGLSVVYVGRPAVLDELARDGLRLTDLDGRDQFFASDALSLSATPPAGAKPALVLLCVKSGATAAAAASLAAVLEPGTPVVSMQNGVSNPEIARHSAPTLRVLAGMVPFNIARVGPGHFHRGTAGALAAEDDPGLRRWIALFARAGLALELHADLAPIQWAKLLLNLNNPVNAFSALPLREELMDRRYRLCFAALQREALRVLRLAAIVPARLTPLPADWLPWMLALPNPLFRVVAARMLRIDAQARSSMADDFARGRPTEIDALCGAVVALAERCGTRAPINRRMVELVQAWPADPRPRSGEELQRALGLP